MSPLAASDGDDARGLVDQLVPGITAMIDDLVVGFEDGKRCLTPVSPVITFNLAEGDSSRCLISA